MALQKLSGLTTFLMAQNLVDCNKIDSWMENGTVMPRSQSLGHGVRICDLKYDAIVSIEDFANDENILLALVCAWLMENDEEREDDDLPPPDIEIDVLDNRRADIELRIVFVENIDLVPDDNGRVTFDGANYDVAPVPVTVPDEAAVGDDDSKPTDKPYVYEG